MADSKIGYEVIRQRGPNLSYSLVVYFNKEIAMGLVKALTKAEPYSTDSVKCTFHVKEIKVY